jgi:hypothetical protein
MQPQIAGSTQGLLGMTGLTVKQTRIALLVHALAALWPISPVGAYKCEGSGCCDTTCSGKDCRVTASGASVPRWWPNDSCPDLVSDKYDARIPCSEALEPFHECGGNTPFACGYGLACVAETITYAHCAPICDPHFSDELLHVDSIAAGCTFDGQQGSFNLDSLGERVPVGEVTLVNGSIAVPACIARTNRYATKIPEKAQLPQQILENADHEHRAMDNASRAKLAAQVVALNLLFWEVRAALSCAYLSQQCAAAAAYLYRSFGTCKPKERLYM